MKTKTTYFIILIVLACLNGCATQPFNSNSASASKTQSSPQDGKIAAFIAASGGTGGYMLPVAATNSFIANKIMLASLKAGSGSTTVDSLIALLKSGKYQQIAVFSENDSSDEITAATIEAALKKVSGIKTTTTLYFIGEESYGVALQEKAQAAGVDFKPINYSE